MRRLVIMGMLVVPALIGLSMWTGVGPVDDWVHNCEVRQPYLDRLEVMRADVKKMRIEGRTEQEIARAMVPRRNEAKNLVKTKMTRKQAARMETRNRLRYGNPAGPTPEWMLHKHDGDWNEVVEAATHSDEFYDLSCIGWFSA